MTSDPHTRAKALADKHELLRLVDMHVHAVMGRHPTDEEIARGLDSRSALLTYADEIRQEQNQRIIEQVKGMKASIRRISSEPGATPTLVALAKVRCEALDDVIAALTPERGTQATTETR